MIDAMNAELRTNSIAELSSATTNAEVMEACEKAITIEDHELRITSLQKLLANATEAELHHSIKRIYECLHEDNVSLFGPNYYEEYTTQQWRDIAYNGTIAVLTRPGEAEAAHNFIGSHAKCLDEFSVPGRLQAIHTFIAHYTRGMPWEYLEKIGNADIKIALTQSLISYETLYTLESAVARLQTENNWPKNPLQHVFKSYTSIRNGTLIDRANGDGAKSLYERTEIDKNDPVIHYFWTPQTAAEAMRQLVITNDV